jgi:hypothetical protein
MRSIVGQAVVPGFAVRNIEQGELHVVNADEPGSLEEAIHDPCWYAAMKEEMQAIVENGTWEMSDLPQGRKAIGLKWVFKVKRNEQGSVIRHKARLVVKGYTQRYGVDY